MVTKPRILLITPGFPADEDDTTCIPALQVYARGLAESLPDYAFEVVALHYPFRTGTYRCFDLDVHSLNLPSGSRIRRWLGLWRALRWLHRFHLQNPVVGVHSFWLNDAAWLGWKLTRRFNLPFLATIMGQDALSANHYHRWVRLPPKCVVAVSQRAAETYGELNRGLPEVVPWGWGPVDAESSRERGIDILGVGALIELKDFRTFVEVLARLKTGRPSLRAVMVGEGSESEALQRMAAELGLNAHCEFTGKLPRAEVLALMAQSKILLHPSTYEAFGYVFLEALGAGMQVVSRPVGIAEPGQRWQVGHSVDELAEACERGLASHSGWEPTWPYPLADVFRNYGGIYRGWFHR